MRVPSRLCALLWPVLAASGFSGQGAAEEPSAAELVAELARVVGDLERQPAIALHPDRLADAFLTGIAAAPTGERYLAVGARGVVLSSPDGDNWVQLSVPIDVTLTAVRIGPDGNGWIGGHEGTLLRVPAGTNSCELLRSDPEFDGPILKFLFTGAGRILALSTYGRILHSADGGETWSEEELISAEAFSPHLFAGIEVGDALVLVGEQGHVFRSRDGGEHWVEMPRPYIGSLFGVANLDGALLAYGITGHAFVSNDLAESWQEIETGVEDSLFTHLSHAGKTYLAGADGAVLVTARNSRQGHPLLSLAMRRPTRATITGLVSGPNGTAVAASSGGLLSLSLK